MIRRDFLKITGLAGAGLAFTGASGLDSVSRAITRRSAFQGVDPLPERVFRRRARRALELMTDHGFGALFSEPGTNFEYLIGTSFGRSERLIALVLPAGGRPLIVAPEFEVERVTQAVGTLAEVRGWAEQQDPYQLVADLLFGLRPARIGIEPSSRYGVARRLQLALRGWELGDATAMFERLRIIKAEDELNLIRRAISITETSIAATFAALEPGVTDREIARYLSEQMRERGARGGGLVQFGPTSALPHGDTEGRRLEYGMPVLIDAGCRVHGYTSDITRSEFFGDDPPPEYRDAFNVVFAAQSAAYEAGKPGVRCQQLDRIARRVIAQAGYGDYFTHRLGHGMGMDSHEPPYLVEGSRRRLEEGMVFTIEPGIYLPDQWGVRIEDDFLVLENSLEPLSSRVERI
ncbi:MAG: Xaa-Pro peptidase family protein [Gemmatimonadota bacterium]